MAFHFSLDTMLRVRQIAEEREERLLSQILQQIAACRQNLLDLAARRTDLLLQRERALAAKTSAAELAFLIAQTRIVEGMQESGQRHLAGLDKLRAQQLNLYEAAHANRSLLAAMREQRLDCFRAEQARAEQRQMDDRFSAAKRLH